MQRELAARGFENFQNQNRKPVDELSVKFGLVAVVYANSGGPGSSQLPPLFQYFRRYNLIQLKVDGDNKLESGDLPKLQASGWFYMAKRGISDPKEVTLTVLVHHLTPKILEALSEHGFKRKRRGVFCRNSDIPAFVISIADLPEKLDPEKLPAFSNPRRWKQAFHSYFGDKTNPLIIDAIIDLYANEVGQVMAKNVDAELLESIIALIGAKRAIAALGKKKTSSTEELLTALNDKNTRVALFSNKRILKSLVGKLSPEQAQKLLGETERNKSKR